MKFFCSLALLLAAVAGSISCSSGASECWPALRQGYSDLDDLRSQGQIGGPAAGAARAALAKTLASCDAAPEFVEFGEGDVDAHIKGYITQLDVAAAADDQKAVRALMQRGHTAAGPPQIQQAHLYGGLNSLHVAASFESASATSALLDSGVSAQLRAKDGWLPVHYARATTPGGVSVVAMLGNSRDAVTARTTAGYSALDLAIGEGDLRKAQCLTKMAQDLGVELEIDVRARELAQRTGKESALQWWDTPERVVPQEIAAVCIGHR